MFIFDRQKRNDIDQLVEDYTTTRSMSRREVFQKSMAAGLSVSAASALLAACGGVPAGNGATSNSPSKMSSYSTLQPVLAIGGAESGGEGVGNTMKLAADSVQTLVIPDCGHWVAEQAPKELLAALTAFLAPYRSGQA